MLEFYSDPHLSRRYMDLNTMHNKSLSFKCVSFIMEYNPSWSGMNPSSSTFGR